MKIRKFLLAAAVAALSAGPAFADTISSTTVVKGMDLPGVKKFDIESFDDNKDGVITVVEAGDHLFHLFDLDSSDVLDNKEFTAKTVLTVIPVKSQTITFRDFDSDGQPELGKYAYDTYVKRSGLYMFDNNKDGLSPDDFVNMSFLEMDKNNSHVIEPEEWRRAYIMTQLPESAQQYRYNN